MKHIIFGAGMIGGYLGGALLKSGQTVGWVVRDATREKLLKGLTLSDYLQQTGHCNQLKFISNSSNNNDNDTSTNNQTQYCWLTVKCTALSQALKDMAPLIRENTVIICLQNGLGAEGIVQAAYPNHQVIRGVMGANITELSAGHLHRGTEGGIELPDIAICRALKTQFTSPLLPLTLYKNLDGLLWAKLQLNLNNAINALADIPLKEELSQHHYRLILASAMDELLTIVKAKHIQLPKLTGLPPSWIPTVLRLPDFLFKLVAKKMLAIDPKARSSMWDDLSNGRPTEIDFINAAIVKEGEALNIACPCNKALSDLVRLAQKNELKIGISGSELKKRCTG